MEARAIDLFCGEAEPFAERPDALCREPAPILEDSRYRGMIGGKLTSKCAKRIARITRPSPVELVLQQDAEVHRRNATGRLRRLQGSLVQKWCNPPPVRSRCDGRASSGATRCSRNQALRFHVDVEGKLLFHPGLAGASPKDEARAGRGTVKPAHEDVRSTASRPAAKLRHFSSSSRVLSTIVGETAATSALGILVGSVAALLAGNLVSPFLFGIPPWDPWTLGESWRC